MISRYASLRQGLVGAWCPSLGASGFRLIDRSGYGNHGTLTNMDPGTDWVPSGGKLALDFDGSNDYVDINVTKPSDTYAVACWAYIRSFSNTPLIYTWTQPTTNDFGFLETNSTGTQIWFGNRNTASLQTSFRTYTLSESLVANRWYHIVALKFSGANTGDLYINGKRETAFTGSLFASSGVANNLRIAAYTVSDFELNGQIDDIRIYNRALTPSEIRLLYTGGRGVSLAPERIKHRRKTTAAATNRRRRIIIGASS